MGVPCAAVGTCACRETHEHVCSHAIATRLYNTRTRLVSVDMYTPRPNGHSLATPDALKSGLLAMVLRFPSKATSWLDLVLKPYMFFGVGNGNWSREHEGEI